MKRTWFQRIRGGGCQTLVMGGKPMFHHLCCLSPFVSSNLVKLFNASVGGWGVMAEQLSGWGHLLLEKTWVKRQAIPPSSPWLHSSHGRWFFTSGCSSSRRGLFVLWMACWFARRGEAVSPHAQAGILMQGSDMFSLVFLLLGASFPHAQTAEVDFPCESHAVARVLPLACANEHLLRRMDSLVAVQ